MRANGRDEVARFGLQQDTDYTDGLQAQSGRCPPAISFVKQDKIGFEASIASVIPSASP